MRADRASAGAIRGQAPANEGKINFLRYCIIESNAVHDGIRENLACAQSMMGWLHARGRVYIFCVVNFNIVISWAGCNIIFDRLCLGWSVRPVRDELPWTRCQISRKWRIFRFQIEMRKRALANRVSTKIELNDIVIYIRNACLQEPVQIFTRKPVKTSRNRSNSQFTDDFQSFL